MNIQTFQNDINMLRQWNRSSEIVLRSLQDKLDYSDTLKLHFHDARGTKQELFLSNIGYQAYKDQGLAIITNKEVSSEIVKLYEVTIPSNLSTIHIVNGYYAPFDNHVVQNFDYIEGEGLTPNDYVSLFSDHFYISWIKAYKQGRMYLIATDQTLIKECERVLILIENELN